MRIEINVPDIRNFIKDIQARKVFSNDIETIVGKPYITCKSRLSYQGVSLNSFPKGKWMSLRTTNIVERLNGEFK